MANHVDIVNVDSLSFYSLGISDSVPKSNGRGHLRGSRDMVMAAAVDMAIALAMAVAVAPGIARTMATSVTVPIALPVAMAAAEATDMVLEIAIGFVPQPGLPEGVLTVSKKECVRVFRPSGSPNTGRPVPPACGCQFPPWHQGAMVPWCHGTPCCHSSMEPC